MNLPNRLTVARMVLIPFIILFMLPIPIDIGFFNEWNDWIARFGMLIALVLFSVASFTDWLDGFIARKQGIVTNFGKLLDPIADKLLVSAAFLGFVQSGRLHVIVLILVLAREFIITGYRMLALEQGQVLAADKFGKMKTVIQIVAILLLFLESAVFQLFSEHAAWISDILIYIHWIADGFVVLSVIATIYSGIRYIRSGFRFLRV